MHTRRRFVSTTSFQSGSARSAVVYVQCGPEGVGIASHHLPLDDEVNDDDDDKHVHVSDLAVLYENCCATNCSRAAPPNRGCLGPWRGSYVFSLDAVSPARAHPVARAKLLRFPTLENHGNGIVVVLATVVTKGTAHRGPLSAEN